MDISGYSKRILKLPSIKGPLVRHKMVGLLRDPHFAQWIQRRYFSELVYEYVSTTEFSLFCSSSANGVDFVSANSTEIWVQGRQLGNSNFGVRIHYI